MIELGSSVASVDRGVDGIGRGHARWATVSVVIPARNEAANIAWVLEHMPLSVDEVILVDGNSTDRTIEVARAVRPDIVVIQEPAPGKGSAVRAGFAAARGTFIAMLDADGSMDPAEVDALIEALAGGADLAKGSRYLNGGGSTDITVLRSFGNRMLLLASNLLYRQSFTELCYGYMAVRASRIPGLELRATGFEIEAELVSKAIRNGLSVVEVPSREASRISGESSLHPFRDGWRILRTIARESAPWRIRRPVPADEPGEHHGPEAWLEQLEDRLLGEHNVLPGEPETATAD